MEHSYSSPSLIVARLRRAVEAMSLAGTIHVFIITSERGMLAFKIFPLISILNIID